MVASIQAMAREVASSLNAVPINCVGVLPSERGRRLLQTVASVTGATYVELDPADLATPPPRAQPFRFLSACSTAAQIQEYVHAAMAGEFEGDASPFKSRPCTGDASPFKSRPCTGEALRRDGMT
eukprot:1195776-Prorocentrum_minimum.AAC.3